MLVGKDNGHNLSRTSGIPAEIQYGRELAIARMVKAGGNLVVNLQGGNYRCAQAFSVNNYQVEIGSINNAPIALKDKYTRQFFEFAAKLATQGNHTTHRFDHHDKTLHAITLHTHEIAKAAYLVYLPSGTASYSNRAGNISVANSFTTREPEGFTVSFVSVGKKQRPEELALAAATEIMQSRCMIDKVTLENGRHSTWTNAVRPFEETLANGTGNMLGAIALGWTYSQYENYLEDYDNNSHLLEGTMSGWLGIGRTVLVAPNIMYDQQTYDLIADGGIPDTPPEIIARQPLAKFL